MTDNKCKKVMYSTQLDAAKSIVIIKKKKGKLFKPLTTYYCEEHECWHLTSSLTWKDKKITEITEELEKFKKLNAEKEKGLKTLNIKYQKLFSTHKELKEHKHTQNIELREELYKLRSWKKEFLKITESNEKT